MRRKAKGEAARAIRADTRGWVSEVARQVQAAFAAGDNRKAFKLTRSLMPSKATSPAMVKLEDGVAAGSGQAARASRLSL